MVDRGGCRMRLERGRPPCLTAKHEKALSDLRTERLDAAEATAWQAGRTAFHRIRRLPGTTNHEPRTNNHQIKTNLTPANTNTSANTRRSVKESNRFAPRVEPITPPRTAAATQIQTFEGSSISCE